MPQSLQAAVHGVPYLEAMHACFTAVGYIVPVDVAMVMRHPTVTRQVMFRRVKRCNERNRVIANVVVAAEQDSWIRLIPNRAIGKGKYYCRKL